MKFISGGGIWEIIDVIEMYRYFFVYSVEDEKDEMSLQFQCRIKS